MDQNSLGDGIVEKETEYDDFITFNNGNIGKNLIFYVNVRSLNANFNKLELTIASLKIKPIIIVCVETWNLVKYEQFSIKEYKIYYNQSKINKSDGVVIYVRDNIESAPKIECIDRLNLMNINIKTNNYYNNIEISALYRSHDIPKNEFLISLKKYLDNKKNIKNHLVIGDFNIDLLEHNTVSQEYLSNFLEDGYMPCFQGVTRPAECNQEGTCIDNFFFKTNTIAYKAIKITQTFTDHYPLFVNIDTTLMNKESNYNPNRINYKKLKNVANKINWNNFLLEDPNVSIDLIIENIQNCICKSKESKKTNKNGKKLPRKNWITKGIIISCNKKEHLYNLWKLDKKNEQLKKDYKTYIKILDKVIKDAKVKHEKKLVEANCNNPKNLWKIINNKIGKRKKENNKIEHIIDDNNTKITNAEHIAEAMNGYFSEIGDILSKKIQKFSDEKINLPPMNPKTIFLKPTSTDEIKTIINNLKNKSGGVDNIHATTLKVLSENIAEPLMHVFNKCIEFSFWPDSLKSAEIVPIYKANEKNKTHNYRPISLISNIAKILEKIIHSRLYNFIINNKIISENQYGFLKNMGTRDAFSNITNIVYNNLDKGIPIIVAFLDLAKAFDTVNHRLLLDKLYQYGIRGSAHRLLNSYLNNRKQRVKVNHTISSYREVKVGVPQGTILGPLLFIIYVNDILESLSKNTIMSYADDTAVISAAKTWEETIKNMNLYLEKISRLLALNKLSLNIDKTVFITFGNYCDSVPDRVEIKINNKCLKRVNSYKYLGVIFDYRLSWAEHINHVIGKTKYLTIIFYKLKQIMTTKTLMLIYYAFFHSVVSYGIIAWGGAYMNNLNVVNNLQKKLIKMISKNTLFTTNLPLNLEQLFSLESLIYHYNSLKTIYLQSESITRNKSIPLPKMIKRVSNKNNYILAIKLYNRLPNH